MTPQIKDGCERECDRAVIVSCPYKFSKSSGSCELKRVDQFLINFFNRPILPFTGCFERLQLAFREIDGVKDDYRGVQYATEGHHSRIMSTVLKLHLFPPSLFPTQST